MERIKAHKNLAGEISSVSGCVNHFTKNKQIITVYNFSISRGEKCLHVVLYDPRDNRNTKSKTIKFIYNSGYALKINKKSVSSSSIEELMRTLSDDLFYVYTKNLLHHFFGDDPFSVMEV